MNKIQNSKSLVTKMNNRDYRDLSVSHGRKYKVIMRQDLTGENSGRRGKKEPVKDKEMV